MVNINAIGDAFIKEMLDLQTLRSAILLMKQIFEKQNFWRH